MRSDVVQSHTNTRIARQVDSKLSTTTKMFFAISRLALQMSLSEERSGKTEKCKTPCSASGWALSVDMVRRWMRQARASTSDDGLDNWLDCFKRRYASTHLPSSSNNAIMSCVGSIVKSRTEIPARYLCSVRPSTLLAVGSHAI
jgi:hypothetical protein